MTTKIVDIIGYVAGGLTTFGILPEIYISFLNKEKPKIAYFTLSLFLIGNLLWILYAYNVKDNILLFYTIIASSLFILLLILKLTFKPIKSKKS